MRKWRKSEQSCENWSYTKILVPGEYWGQVFPLHSLLHLCTLGISQRSVADTYRGLLQRAVSVLSSGWRCSSFLGRVLNNFFATGVM